MHNPRALVHALHTHWDVVEVLARLTREFPMLTHEQVLHAVGRAAPRLDAEARGAVLRALVNASILQTLPRSSDLQLDAHVLAFVRGLTREHELGLTAVLQARVTAIREATERLNDSLVTVDIDGIRGAAHALAALFRDISLQLDQDRHAIRELAEKAKSADSRMPIGQRYRDVLNAFDQYVEPMNQMMDSGPEGSFYRHLENAEQALDAALERLMVQGALYSHRLQLRQVAHQAKELRRFGRQVAQQCADTLLPLREELRQHNALSAAISALLGQVRKRGLRRALSRPVPDSALPLWRHERGFRVQLGDEIREIMAAARHYEPRALGFPADAAIAPQQLPEHVDEAEIRAHVARSLPIDSLLDWLNAHYAHLQDATLLRLFHDLQHDTEWQCEAVDAATSTALRTIRIHHHPHRMSSAS